MKKKFSDLEIQMMMSARKVGAFGIIGLFIGVCSQGYFALKAFAEEGSEKHEEVQGEPSGVGPGKAVTAASQKEGVKLSPQALQKLEIKTEPVSSKGSSFQLSPGSVVYFQAQAGVYRLRDGWFKMAEGKVSSKSSSSVVFESKDLQQGDQVVTQGGQLIRLAELNIWSGGGDAD